MAESPAAPSSPSEEGGDPAAEEEEEEEEENVGGSVDVRSDPSSSRPRSTEAVWPDHFVESVAVRVAVDAARTSGRLAAAPAIATVFQVCSTWRSVSRSELLWEEVTRRVWSRQHPLLPSWRHEFARLHRTALNFRTRRSSHSHLLPPSLLSCRRLSLSDFHLAAGYLDGSVRLFDLPDALHTATIAPHSQRPRLGLYSHSISGLVFLSFPSHRLVFASQDGDIHVAAIPSDSTARQAYIGNPVDDGPLVDFTGDERRWVGLFAGAPGRSWHVWDAETEQLLYVGGSLTDPYSVTGWRLLTDSNGPALARTIIDPDQGIAVGCTESRIQVIDLDDNNNEVVNIGSVIEDLELRRAAIVDSVDGSDGRVMVVDQRGTARVRIGRSLEEVCRFSTVRRGHEDQVVAGGLVGCMNWGYALVCLGGEIRVWDAATGEYLYRFRERIGAAGVITASERYVAAWASDTGLHLWDFGE